MTEQLTRKQLREARLAGLSAPEVPANPSVAGDQQASTTSVPVDIAAAREFQLSGPFGGAAPITQAPRGENSESTGQFDLSSDSLTPDELLRKFRERIRSNYQDGSIVVPQAKMPERATQPVEASYALDIESIRQRLREAAAAARLQAESLETPDPLSPGETHETEQVREITEYDIAARQSSSTLQVEALRESFAGLKQESATTAEYSVDTQNAPRELQAQDEVELPSRRQIRLESAVETPEAPFATGVLPTESSTTPAPELAESVSESNFPNQQIARESTETSESVDFIGKNLLAEPSTQSIVLDVIPDAVTMPINLAADSLTTGSISIIPEQSVSDVTGAIAGIKADESTLKDTVTGAVSVIEPVSALAVIAERRHHAVLPMTSLRRGWWQPYAVAVGILAMIGAAAYSVFLILEVLNS